MKEKSVIATIRFTMPEHQEDLQYAIHGIDYKIALDEMDNYLRARLKYEELSEEVATALQTARDHLSGLTKDLPQ